MKIKDLVSMLGVRRRTEHYPYKVTEHDVGGGNVVMYAQWQHPGETTKAITPELVAGYRRYVKEGDFCIDIGAHTGDSALPMALAAGLSGCVLALEPNPYVYPVLEKTSRLNPHLCNIMTIMAAAGTKEGFIEFEYSDAGFCNGGRHEGISPLRHGHAFKLAVFAIDLERELRSDYAALLPRLSFIKIDAEGYDLYVLRSISGVIREFRPVIKAEVFKKTSLKYRQEMLRFFQDHDYTVRIVDSDPLGAGSVWIQDGLRVGEHFDILALPDRVARQ